MRLGKLQDSPALLLFISFLRLLCFFWVVSIVQMRVQCNIRGKNGQFYASFNRVVANTKMKKTSQNFIKGGEFINHTLRNCVVECALEQRCNSINYHKKNEKCQLMKRTTTARENLLFKKDGWTFYETDPATRNVSLMNLVKGRDTLSDNT